VDTELFSTGDAVPAADGDEPPQAAEPAPKKSRKKLIRIGAGVVIVAALLTFAPFGWVFHSSAGHRDPRPTPSAPVGIVFGAQLQPDGKPKPYLAGRISTAARLYREGKVRALLVSGDAKGTSGNEIQAMTKFLVAEGVPASRVVADPDGLDTYDTCARAHDTYGVSKALLISQDFHLPRAVTLCRQLGIDADGVSAPVNLGTFRVRWRNRIREVFADAKAVIDVVRHRPPAVSTPRTNALTEAAA
jgi:vancomycin permeability regulator SanA